MVAQVVAALQSAGEGDDPMLVLEALGPHLGLDDKFNRRLQPGARGGTSAAGPHAVPGILGTSRAAGKVNWAEAAAAAHVRTKKPCCVYQSGTSTVAPLSYDCG